MRNTVVAVLILGAVGGMVGYGIYQRHAAAPPQGGPGFPPGSGPLCDPDSALLLPVDPRVPVTNNRGLDVPDGYRGDVHPTLRHQEPMEVKAYWEHPTSNYFGPNAPSEVESLYHGVSVAAPVRSYAARDFSAIMPPDTVDTAGQVWALDQDRLAEFLKQFRPAVSTRSASAGRRPGPDGAFAVLQGISPSHLDVAFRIHAEFDLVAAGDDWLLKAWYSPAFFMGRMVVDRNAGAVTYFHLGVPTDRKTNLHSTCWTRYGLRVHNTHRVERMELVGGRSAGLEGVPWASRIEAEQADDKLATVFYKFREINFVRFDRALAGAKEQKRPIVAIVLLGALDDQSC